MNVPNECVDCKVFGEQFLLANTTLSEATQAAQTNSPPYPNRNEELIGFLSELRDLIAHSHRVHRENHSVADGETRVRSANHPGS